MPQPWLGNPVFFPRPPIKVVSRELIPPSPPSPRDTRVRRINEDGHREVVRRRVPTPPKIIAPPSMTTAEKIIHSACLMFGVPKAQLLGATRERLCVGARTYASLRLRTELGLSMPQIGRMLNRDHTSILNLLRKAEGIPVSVRNGVAWRRPRAMEAGR